MLGLIEWKCKLAERAGFEPAVARGDTAFRERHHQPHSDAVRACIQLSKPVWGQKPE